MISLSNVEFEAMLTQEENDRMNAMLHAQLDHKGDKNLTIGYYATLSQLLVKVYLDGDDAMTLYFESKPALTDQSKKILEGMQRLGIEKL